MTSSPTSLRADDLRLVAVDMDGTFLDPSSTYDRERFDRLYRRLQDAGTRFVVASGNQYWQLLSYFEGFPDVLYIAENGALIATADTVLRTSPFRRAEAEEALALVDALPDVFALACGLRSAYALTTTDPDIVALMRHYYRRFELVESWSEVDEDVLKVALGCPVERTASLLEELSGHLPAGIVPTSSGHGSIDLISRDVNKGVALAWLGRQLGIEPEHMLAFGDGGNDLEMLALAGVGVAMGNAPEPIKAGADAVAGGNDEHGVLAYLEELLDRTPAGDPSDRRSA